jgi:hypothetical protein
MKQVFSIILLALAGVVPSFAQTMLKVSLADRTPIKVSLDGRFFNKRGETVTIDDLPQGRHFLKIFAMNPNQQGTQAEEMIYEGKVKTYRGQLTLFVYDANTGMANISDQDIPYNPPMAARDNGETYNNHNLNNYDTRENNTGNAVNNQPANENTNDNTTATTPLPPGTPLVSPATSNDELDKIEKAAAKEKKVAAAPKTLKDPKLEKARKKVAAKKTDTEKLATAKQVFDNQKLTTAQVMVIMGLFDFENSKVDFAKWAYPNVTDKENYKKIKANLGMKNYKADMDKFLKENK